MSEHKFNITSFGEERLNERISHKNTRTMGCDLPTRTKEAHFEYGDSVVRSDFLLMKKGALAIRRRKYFKLFRQSFYGKARLEVFTTKKASVSEFPEFVVLSSDVASITLTTEPDVGIAVVSKNAMMHLITDSKENTQIWLKVLREILIYSTRDSFSPITETEFFDTLVEVLLTGDLAKTYGKEASYLEVKESCIHLFNSKKESVQTWPMKTIRMFGSDKREFHFDTGHQAPGGPQHYSFKTFKGGSQKLVDFFASEKERMKAAAKECKFLDADMPLSSATVGNYPKTGTPNYIPYCITMNKATDQESDEDQYYGDIYEDFTEDTNPIGDNTPEYPVGLPSTKGPTRPIGPTNYKLSIHTNDLQKSINALKLTGKGVKQGYDDPPLAQDQTEDIPGQAVSIVTDKEPFKCTDNKPQPEPNVLSSSSPHLTRVAGMVDGALYAVVEKRQSQLDPSSKDGSSGSIDRVP